MTAGQVVAPTGATTMAPVLRADVAVALSYWLSHPELTERDLSRALDHLARSPRCAL